MKSNKKIIVSLVGVLMMLLLIISATYAYFSVTITGDGSKTMITANTPKKHSLSVSTLYDDIHIHVDNNDMKLANIGRYYGAVDKDNRYEKTKEEGTHNIIEVSSKGMENIRYSCSGDIKVTLENKDGSMGSVLDKEDVLLYLKGLGLDETLDLSTLKVNNTKVYNTSFEIDGDSSDYLSAIVELINKESYQNYIANKMLNVSIEADNMVCRENGTYKYLVKLNKNIKEKQNGKETSKTVSIFYDDEGIYQKIQNIYLVDYINTSKAIKTWELGDTERGTKLDEVLGWLKATPDIEDSYDLYIGANGPMQAPKDMSYAFYNFINLKKITGDVLDTSEVTNMSYLFRQNTNLTDISALSNWDVSKVTNMESVFDSSGISDITSLANWDVSNVTTLWGLFSKCTNLTDISSLSNWDVSHVTAMPSIFNSTKVSDLTPLSNWDVSNVTLMSYVFENNRNLISLIGLENWDVSHVMSMQSIFYNTSISDLTPLTNWDMSSMKDMGGMFYGTLISDLSPLTSWNVSSATSMGNMFYNTKINDLTPIANWNVSKVTNMSNLFAYTLIDDISPLKNWNMSSITNIGSMFNYTLIDNIEVLSKWDVSQVTNMNSLFQGTLISDITPLKDWQTSKVTTMESLFNNCQNLEDISALLNWDVSNVTTTGTTYSGGLFSGTKIKDLSPLKNWNVSNMTDMRSMFSGTLISDLSPISGWDTRSAIDMSGMFANTQISDLTPISGWNVSHVTNLGTNFHTIPGMFQNCRNLTKVDLSSWNVPKLTDISKMFSGCTSLSELKLPKASYKNIVPNNYVSIFASVPKNITVYTESSQVQWVTDRLQEALEENNNSTVIAY